MNPLRYKMAMLLTDMAYKGISRLDPKSTCAKALKKIDVGTVLREDINRICNSATIGEIAKIIAFAGQLRVTSEDNKQAKSDLKELAEEIVARVERETGKLKIPQSCRHLLLKL